MYIIVFMEVIGGGRWLCDLIGENGFIYVCG